ncbi:MAG: cytochrome c maturation protein CcmE [Bdellovibrionales bacterium]|nr:cytochrome c maturation protein CcmE [Bdellovibrionales bacterium]
MVSRFVLLVLVVLGGIGALMYSAVNTTARAVVTVQELRAQGGPVANVQLGGRVTDSPIDYQTTPEFLLRFTVKDIPDGEHAIPVVYHGIMPDTLQNGRDVILGGDFDGTTFLAHSLLTQCPSKYEAALPQGG